MEFLLHKAFGFLSLLQCSNHNYVDNKMLVMLALLLLLEICFKMILCYDYLLHFISMRQYGKVAPEVNFGCTISSVMDAIQLIY